LEELKAKNRITSTLELADGDNLIIAKSEAFDMFRNRVQGTSRALFGAYDQFGQPEGNKLALYRLYFFMRKWFTPMFVNRFGGEAVFEDGRWIPKIKARYDWATGTTKKGYYITAFQAMAKMLTSRGKSIKYLEEKEQELEIPNIQKTMQRLARTSKIWWMRNEDKYLNKEIK
jgi:hypothetical protein